MFDSNFLQICYLCKPSTFLKICSNLLSLQRWQFDRICKCRPKMLQKRTFACGLIAFAVRAKIINCYKFNCILNLHICNIFIHIYHGANMVTYITFGLRTKLLCMMTFARHLTGVACGKFTIPTVTLQLLRSRVFF